MKEIRDRLDKLLTEMDKSFLPHDEPIEEGNIPQNKIDNTYFIAFGQTNTIFRAESYTDVTDVSITIYSNSGHDKNKSFDCLYANAICIKNKICNLKSIDDSLYFNLDDITINPSSIVSDERIFQMTINFKVSVSYIF